MSSRTLNLVGMDPSMNNWGLAFGAYDLDTKKLLISRLDVLNPILPTGKMVRQNSSDIEVGVQHFKGACAAAAGAHAVFVEVPHGSQSSRAMASYGICVGVLGAMRSSGIPFFELTAKEVKLAGAGFATAKKRDQIQWAMKAHPEAGWPMYRRGGEDHVSEAQAEHMADAIAAIYAGLACNSFQQVLPFIGVNS